MGILIALLGILLILLICDVQMRLSYYPGPGNRFPNLSRLQFWGLRSIVAVVQTYGGYRIAKLKGLVRNPRGCVYRVRLLNLYPPPRGRSEVQDML